MKIQSKWSETMSIVTFLFVIGLFFCPECIFSFQILLNFQLALKEKVIFAKTKTSLNFTYLLSTVQKRPRFTTKMCLDIKIHSFFGSFATETFCGDFQTPWQTVAMFLFLCKKGRKKIPKLTFLDFIF